MQRSLYKRRSQRTAAVDDEPQLRQPVLYRALAPARSQHPMVPTLLPFVPPLPPHPAPQLVLQAADEHMPPSTAPSAAGCAPTQGQISADLGSKTHANTLSIVRRVCVLSHDLKQRVQRQE